MSGVLIKRENLDKETNTYKGRTHIKMKTEIGVRLLQDKEQ